MSIWNFIRAQKKNDDAVFFMCCTVFINASFRLIPAVCMFECTQMEENKWNKKVCYTYGLCSEQFVEFNAMKAYAVFNATFLIITHGNWERNSSEMCDNRACWNEKYSTYKMCENLLVRMKNDGRISNKKIPRHIRWKPYDTLMLPFSSSQM